MRIFGLPLSCGTVRVHEAPMGLQYSVPELLIEGIGNQQELDATIIQNQYAEPFSYSTKNMVNAWYSSREWLPTELSDSRWSLIIQQLKSRIGVRYGDYAPVKLYASGKSATVFTVESKPEIIIRY